MIEIEDAGGSFDLVLDPPIKTKGGECAALTLTEPRAKHVRDAEKRLDARMSEASVTDYEMALIKACSGADEEIIKALGVRQAGAAMNFLQPFIGDPTDNLDDDALDDLPEATFEVAIDPALTWQKNSYPSLTLREPTLEELKRARQFTKQAFTPYTIRCRDMELLRLVTGLPPAVIDGLRIRTLTEASRQLARFIKAGQRAGKA